MRREVSSDDDKPLRFLIDHDPQEHLLSLNRVFLLPDFPTPISLNDLFRSAQRIFNPFLRHLSALDFLSRERDDLDAPHVPEVLYQKKRAPLVDVGVGAGGASAAVGGAGGEFGDDGVRVELRVIAADHAEAGGWPREPAS